MFSQANKAQAQKAAQKMAAILNRLEVSVAVNDCHVQLPVQDSKNSLFVELSSLTFNSMLPLS